MWVAAVVLLRAVGHVLSKIDATKSAKHKEEIGRLWEDWKLEREGNWIFWDFIENERNNIVKAYQFGVELYDEGIFHTEIGEDGVELLFEGIYWWQRQLMALERAIASP